jgi:hypothetical protein
MEVGRQLGSSSSAWYHTNMMLFSSQDGHFFTRAKSGTGIQQNERIGTYGMKGIMARVK